MSYIDTNTKIGRQNLNADLLKEAYSYIDKNNVQVYRPYFVSSEGTDAFYRKDYKLAIDKLTKALLSYNDQWPHQHHQNTPYCHSLKLKPWCKTF